MNTLLILIIISIILLFLFKPYNEPFVSDLTIINPYSLYLFRDISRKEAWWNKTHGRKLYYYRDYVPQIFKE